MSHYDPDEAPTAEEIAQRLTDGDELLHLDEAAEFLRSYPSTLRDWRHHEIGPRSFLIGRNIVYFKFDLIAWLAEQAANPKRSPRPRRMGRSREAG
jgi:hypothetical protein